MAKRRVTFAAIVAAPPKVAAAAMLAIIAPADARWVKRVLLAIFMVIKGVFL